MFCFKRQSCSYQLLFLCLIQSHYDTNNWNLFFWYLIDAIERKEQKIANLDEDLLKELIADENDEKEKTSKKALKKQRQKDEKLRQRLAAAKKNRQKDADDADEEDDEDISVFAKGKSKKR